MGSHAPDLDDGRQPPTPAPAERNVASTTTTATVTPTAMAMPRTFAISVSTPPLRLASLASMSALVTGSLVGIVMRGGLPGVACGVSRASRSTRRR